MIDWISLTDINECEIKDGGCSNICINTAGSFHCACMDGYNIAEDDQYKCIGKQKYGIYLQNYSEFLFIIVRV